MISLKKRRFVFDRRAPAVIFRTRKIVNTFSFQCSPFILPRFQEVEIGRRQFTHLAGILSFSPLFLSVSCARDREAGRLLFARNFDWKC